ncbi:Ig-like domain-containing alpha-2-macroglobulin family protein [Comamonas piscis]|uniref:Ig-like domain-containing alpha-2-macroglobulin family protein n=1 Tax=Comamonas piscis TaxID=1562974 RepID=UPI001EE16171|nr:Ig-like domain-containing alpha-2-macroglobulin family protein [Comamonas piscis]WSO33396.1 MG2 domain-containing protein [Comamonas piscis]
MNTTLQRWLAGAGWAALGLSAHATTITSVSPQGEVARVRQIVVKFDAAVVPMGDLRAAAPVKLDCDNKQAQSQGTGRWTGPREWVFDLADDLPPGVRCTVEKVANLKDAAGEPVKGAAKYSFATGGPSVTRIVPGSYQALDSRQFFGLQFNADVVTSSVEESSWCAVKGIGERIPVRLLHASESDHFMQSQFGRDALQQKPRRYVALQCQRALPEGAQMSLVVGAGVSTDNGVKQTRERRFDYQVRPPFTAEFSCERANAQAGCLPIRPLNVFFSASVDRKLAEGIYLETSKGRVKASFADDGDDSEVSRLQFAPPFGEKETMRIVLPQGFKDESDRPLANANLFPLQVQSGLMPPLAKFAASPFGVVERFAEGDKGPAMFPVTLRNVEQDLQIQGLSIEDKGTVSTLQLQSDADIIRWYRKLQRWDNWQVSRKQAALDSKSLLPNVLPDGDKQNVETRMLSLLDGQASGKKLALPKTDSKDPRPFEVVGIPLETGFHVVEIASPMLGDALLNTDYDSARRVMYVRSSALVTNLGVHFKLGRENAMAWVTSLDKGKPVANAQVRISTCDGKTLVQGTTDKDGVARFDKLDTQAQVRCEAGANSDTNSAYFVSARATVDGKQDMAFVWSDWQRGIESWRFNLETDSSPVQDVIAHTVLDRSLLRAGETVSMKHLIRSQTMGGLGLPGKEQLPNQVVITHQGSNDEFVLPISWDRPGQGLSAVSEFKIPKSAKLGSYSISLKGGKGKWGSMEMQTTSFRVEEYRLPVFKGSVTPDVPAPIVQPGKLGAQVQLSYLSGGAAAKEAVKVSAAIQSHAVSFEDYDTFSFGRPYLSRKLPGAGNDGEDYSNDRRVIADKLALTLDANGVGKAVIEEVPTSVAPQDLLLEASFSDPNGEVQTISNHSVIWPASVVAGIKAENWASTDKKLSFQALSLTPSGKPVSGVKLQVRAVARVVTSTRKRMVGGFYSYENHESYKDLGIVCSGKSDAKGLLACDTQLNEGGETELIAEATDDKNRSSKAATSVWVTKQGELWFGGEDTDRMDLLPEKKSYKVGDTARFQVRMPFREATALVTVEREGVLSSQVITLRGDDPTVSLKVQEGWGPNVYVSVMALRGRLREVPWYSFFTWGFKSPREWWTSFWYEGKEYVAPTALVDLSKPAYRLGAAEIRVGIADRQLAVTVKSDKENYRIRNTAKVTIEAKLPNGKPAAGAAVSVAAVDQALLELKSNDTWALLEAMYQKRSWGVETSTAQMEIIGRRHYGRKAVAAGGGGGNGQTRELLDTLLLWQPNVVLDANGRAEVDVPLNDALTSFKIVAVAESGLELFGTGSTQIRTSQELQIISGLPPLVRDSDRYDAQVTLRNTTNKPMQVLVTPKATLLQLEPQTVEIAANEARTVSWSVTAPAEMSQSRQGELLWEISAKDKQSDAADALKVSQRVVPAVAVETLQATLVQLDGSLDMPVSAPADALPGRGGLKLSLVPRLAEGLPGVRDWWRAYPYACLEQTTSKSIGMQDAALWKSTMERLPTYLDGDGLANYFPPQAGSSNTGSDALTAHLLQAAFEMKRIDPAFAIPAAPLGRMQDALARFIDGRIERKFWSPRSDLEVRKLAAINALALYGKAQPRMLTSIQIAPNDWPTQSVVDWLSILGHMKDAPNRSKLMEEANQILRARLSYQGTKVLFANENNDYWWWLMQNGDTTLARFLLVVMDDPAWKDDMPRLASSFISRQKSGAWTTTTANLWGALALERFSRTYESIPVTGTTEASMAGKSGTVDWSRVTKAQDAIKLLAQGGKRMPGPTEQVAQWLNNTIDLPWASGNQSLKVQQKGTGKPWLTVQSQAAVPLKQPLSAGYTISKTVVAVEQANKNLPAGQYTRGDVLRVTLEVNASANMTWVAITDPIPGGATILGSGLGRDSALSTAGEKSTGWGWKAFEERSFESYRAYYGYLPQGKLSLQYSYRVNNTGEFALPSTRVEALYAPEMFGMAPNPKVTVVPVAP